MGKACVEKKETKERNEHFVCCFGTAGLPRTEQVLMQKPSVEDFVCMLERCKQVKDRLRTLRLHVYISNSGLESHELLGSYLVSTFVNVDSLDEGQRAFDKLEHQNEHSSNALIIGYVKCGMPYNALNLYRKLKACQLIHGTAHTFVALLKACSQVKVLERGFEIHAAITKHKTLEGDLFVGNGLINMYIKCGLLEKAEEVFDKLPLRNVVSWTTMIAGYITYRQSEKALDCYENMQLEGVFPDAITFIFAFQACKGLGSMDKGQEIHNQIVKTGLLGINLSVGNSLVDMYAKGGLIAEAKEAFESLPVKDVVSWTSLLTGYVEHGYIAEVHKAFVEMQQRGIQPNAFTFVSILKACVSRTEAIQKGCEMHAEIERKGLLNESPILGNALVDMYCRCGFVKEAEYLFRNLTAKDIVSWNTLIAGYAEHALGHEAMECFDAMLLEGARPNATTFVSILKVCGSLQASDTGRDIHAVLAREGILEKDLIVSTALVDMYTKCGLMVKAQEVFDNLIVQNIVTWNTLISGYAEHGHGDMVLKIYERMQFEGVAPDAITLLSYLKACASIAAVDTGQAIHDYIKREGSEGNLLVGTALVDLHAKRGLLIEAHEAFDSLRIRNVISWNVIVKGYIENGYAEESLNCFELMQLEGVRPNSGTFVCILKACSKRNGADEASEIHCQLARKGSLENDINMGNTLVDMYGKCGLLDRAQEVFDRLPVRNVLSWNALITGFNEHGHGHRALDCYYKMQLEGVRPDVVTYVCILKSCASVGAMNRGEGLHSKMALCEGLMENVVVINTLLHMYAKCGSLMKAQDVFAKAPIQNAVSWNALISGYAEYDYGDEALRCFERMASQGMNPNNATYISGLKACASVGATSKGRAIHADIERKGCFGRDVAVDSALVNMYAKCGMLTAAQRVFDKVPIRGTVLWNSMIAGYARGGSSESVFHSFHKMLEEGTKPDLVTFLNLLRACSQSGMPEKSRTLFEAMSRDFGMLPDLKHHTCRLHLLGRVGHFDGVANLVAGLPFSPDRALWRSVLGACAMSGNATLGMHAFKHTE